jgi:hypothetical protein
MPTHPQQRMRTTKLPNAFRLSILVYQLQPKRNSSIVSGPLFVSSIENPKHLLSEAEGAAWKTCPESFDFAQIKLHRRVQLSDHFIRPHSHFGFSILDFRLHNHLITRSALAKTFGGIVTPICLAAFRLIKNSKLVGCSTGSSDGLAPRKILST